MNNNDNKIYSPGNLIDKSDADKYNRGKITISNIMTIR